MELYTSTHHCKSACGHLCLIVSRLVQSEEPDETPCYIVAVELSTGRGINALSLI